MTCTPFCADGFTIVTIGGDSKLKGDKGKQKMLITSSVSFVHPAVDLTVFIPTTFDQQCPENIRSLSASKPFQMQQADTAGILEFQSIAAR